MQVFPREDTAGCEKYDDILISFCDTGDVYCDSGDESGVHGSYFKTYKDDVVKYIVDKYEAATGGASGTTTATVVSSTTVAVTGTTTAPATTTDTETTAAPTASRTTSEEAPSTTEDASSPTDTGAGSMLMPGLVAVPALAVAMYNVL